MRYLIFLFCFNSFFAFAQNTDEKLAAQYFAEKKYQEAADLYENLASKQSESVYYYDNLLQCYILLNDFKSAEKLVDKRIRKFNEIYAYKVDKAYLFQLQNLNDKKDDAFKSLLKTKISSPEQAELLANAFLKRRFYNQAIEVYLEARKSLKEDLLFAYSLSDLYFYNSNVEQATLELVKMAGYSEYVIEDVKNKFVISYNNTNQYKILSNTLLVQLQKNPDNYAYNELLVWSFTQQKDWNGALIQSKAVDKRLKEEGRKLLELAPLLILNEEYEYAIKCFEYVKSLGIDKRYFYQAQQGILNCGIMQVRLRNGASPERLIAMEKEYLGFISANGVNWQTAEQIKELSELYIYYMQAAPKAIIQLNKVMGIPGVNPKLLAECKLALGDAQLIVGETWEADLLYKQVEKAFMNDALGQEAKYRYARLCYYRAEFSWSQTQLDVLKEATTQLISNNAMRLWLIIQDNLGLDSTEEALGLYAKADLFIFQNKLDEAIVVLNQIPLLFPEHTLVDEILFAQALISEKQSKYADAEVLYLKLIRDFSTDILADNALINLAKLYEFKLNDTAKAKKIYEILVLNYTGSLFANEARKRYRFLRGDVPKEEVN
jgi:tetratricopeptide (TPR) repeat protein